MEELTLLNQISFWLFAALMISSALGVVFHRSIVYSALLLLVAFLSVSAFFIMLNAPFIAAAQILVYGVGLTIIIIFGIMLTGDKPIKDPVGQERPRRYWLIPAVVSFIFLLLLTGALLYPNAQLTTINGLFTSRVAENMFALGLPGIQAVMQDGGAEHIGQLLFSKYLVPFELASILLLLAMIGAIVLSKRVFPEEEGDEALSLMLKQGDFDKGEKSHSCSGCTCGSMSNSLGESSTFDNSSEDSSEKEALGVR